jgi:hypothetical protein
VAEMLVGAVSASGFAVRVKIKFTVGLDLQPWPLTWAHSFGISPTTSKKKKKEYISCATFITFFQRYMLFCIFFNILIKIDLRQIEHVTSNTMLEECKIVFLFFFYTLCTQNFYFFNDTSRGC